MEAVRHLLRGALFLAAAVLLVGALVFTALHSGFFKEPFCNVVEPVLAKASDGKSALYIEDCSTNGAVDLLWPSGHRETAFRYADADGILADRGIPLTGSRQPSAVWLSPNSLKISIGNVSAIWEQRYKVGDVVVTYDIGRNLHADKNTDR